MGDALGAGLYHVGVEVFGVEFMYANQNKPLGTAKSKDGFLKPTTGIIRHSPRAHAFHAFSRSIDLGFTEFSSGGVSAMIKEMGKDFRVDNYDLISRNCVAFANALTQALGVGPIPSIFFGRGRFEDEALGQGD